MKEDFKMYTSLVILWDIYKNISERVFIFESVTPKFSFILAKTIKSSSLEHRSNIKYIKSIKYVSFPSLLLSNKYLI